MLKLGFRACMDAGTRSAKLPVLYAARIGGTAEALQRDSCVDSVRVRRVFFSQRPVA